MKEGYLCELPTRFIVRKARQRDTSRIQTLLVEWLGREPPKNRSESIGRATRSGQILVAERSGKVAGFIHFVVHEDIVDGAPNAFITAFYVSKRFRRRGAGSSLLRRAIEDSKSKGVVSMETSTTHREAMKFYKQHGFRQAMGDIGEVFLELDL